MTFLQLKEAIDRMTTDQLAARAIWWGDDRGGEIVKVEILDEDYVSFGDGMEPVSAYTDDPDCDLDSADAVMKAGTPVLISDT